MEDTRQAVCEVCHQEDVVPGTVRCLGCGTMPARRILVVTHQCGAGVTLDTAPEPDRRDFLFGFAVGALVTVVTVAAVGALLLLLR